MEYKWRTITKKILDINTRTLETNTITLCDGEYNKLSYEKGGNKMADKQKPKIVYEQRGKLYEIIDEETGERRIYETAQARRWQASEIIKLKHNFRAYNWVRVMENEEDIGHWTRKKEIDLWKAPKMNWNLN